MLQGLRERWQIAVLLAAAVSGGIWILTAQSDSIPPAAIAVQPSCSTTLTGDGMPSLDWTGLDGVVEISRDGTWLTNAEAAPFVDRTAPGGLNSYQVALVDNELGASCGSVEVQQRYQCQAQDSLLITECEALLDIMFDDSGIHLLNRPDYLPDADPCRWVPVNCENRRVVSIELDNFGLTSLSPSIGQLRELRVFQARWNEFSELPPEIGQLSNLSAIFLKGNQLSALPDEFAELLALEQANLDENEFTVFPAALFALDELRYLSMTGNKLVDIPAGIGQLQSLRGLSLLRNEILSLPPEIGRLQELLQLDLGGNLLRELPLEMNKLSQLEGLALASNLLTRVPVDELMGLPSLIALDLSQNQMGGPIPKELLVHPTLETLSLVGNRLEGAVPSEIQTTEVRLRLGLQLGCLTAEDTELSEFMTRTYPFWQGGC